MELCWVMCTVLVWSSAWSFLPYSSATAIWCSSACPLAPLGVGSVQSGSSPGAWELCAAFALSVALKEIGIVSDEPPLAQAFGVVWIRLFCLQLEKKLKLWRRSLYPVSRSLGYHWGDFFIRLQGLAGCLASISVWLLDWHKSTAGLLGWEADCYPGCFGGLSLYIPVNLRADIVSTLLILLLLAVFHQHFSHFFCLSPVVCLEQALQIGVSWAQLELLHALYCYFRFNTVSSCSFMFFSAAFIVWALLTVAVCFVRSSLWPQAFLCCFLAL